MKKFLSLLLAATLQVGGEMFLPANPYIQTHSEY